MVRPTSHPQDKNKTVHMAFLDLEKALSSFGVSCNPMVSQQSMWGGSNYYNVTSTVRCPSRTPPSITKWWICQSHRLHPPRINPVDPPVHPWMDTATADLHWTLLSMDDEASNEWDLPGAPQPKASMVQPAQRQRNAAQYPKDWILGVWPPDRWHHQHWQSRIEEKYPFQILWIPGLLRW